MSLATEKSPSRRPFRFKMILKPLSSSVKSSSGSLFIDSRPSAFADNSDDCDDSPEEDDVVRPLAVDNFRRTAAFDALESESMEQSCEASPRPRIRSGSAGSPSPSPSPSSSTHSCSSPDSSPTPHCYRNTRTMFPQHSDDDEADLDYGEVQDEGAPSYVNTSSPSVAFSADDSVDEYWDERWIRLPIPPKGPETGQKRKRTPLRGEDDTLSDKRPATSFSSNSTFLLVKKEPTSAEQQSVDIVPPQPVPPPTISTVAMDTTMCSSSESATLSAFGNSDSEEKENIDSTGAPSRRFPPVRVPAGFRHQKTSFLTTQSECLDFESIAANPSDWTTRFSSKSSPTVNNILVNLKREPVERREDPSENLHLLPPPPAPPSILIMNTTLSPLEEAASTSSEPASAPEPQSTTTCPIAGSQLTVNNNLLNVKQEPVDRREDPDQLFLPPPPILPSTSNSKSLRAVEGTSSEAFSVSASDCSSMFGADYGSWKKKRDAARSQPAVSSANILVKRETLCRRDELNGVIPPSHTTTTVPVSALEITSTPPDNSPAAQILVADSVGQPTVNNFLLNVKLEPCDGWDEPIDVLPPPLSATPPSKMQEQSSPVAVPVETGSFITNEAPASVAAVQSSPPSTAPTSSHPTSGSDTVVDPWAKSVHMMSQDEDFPCFYKLWFDALLVLNRRLRTDAGLTAASYIAVDDCHLATNSSAPDEWTNSVRHMMLDGELPNYYKIWLKQLISEIRQLRVMAKGHLARAAR